MVLEYCKFYFMKRDNFGFAELHASEPSLKNIVFASCVFF